jgi:PIN domain nuclease of toxin-antitoxin system
VADRPEIVIDTAPLLAFLGGAVGGLGSNARRALRRASAGHVRLVVPTVCLFEVGQLAERGRIVLGLSFDEWCDRLVAVPALRIVPLEIAHVSEARALPSLRDPFDRLIAGTAVALGVPLLTSDTRISSSGRVRVVW